MSRLVLTGSDLQNVTHVLLDGVPCGAVEAVTAFTLTCVDVPASTAAQQRSAVHVPVITLQERGGRTLPPFRLLPAVTSVTPTGSTPDMVGEDGGTESDGGSAAAPVALFVRLLALTPHVTAVAHHPLIATVSLVSLAMPPPQDVVAILLEGRSENTTNASTAGGGGGGAIEGTSHALRWLVVSRLLALVGHLRLAVPVVVHSSSALQDGGPRPCQRGATCGRRWQG